MPHAFSNAPEVLHWHLPRRPTAGQPHRLKFVGLDGYGNSWNAEIELDSNKIESWYTKNRLVQTSLPKL